MIEGLLIAMEVPEDDAPTQGQRVAEFVAFHVGSWKFIGVQSIIIAIWAVLNITGVVKWDMYPFILLNLFMSLQAAYTAPLILMAQNRQNEKDRKILYSDFTVDAETNVRLKRMEEKLNEFLQKTQPLGNDNAS